LPALSDVPISAVQRVARQVADPAVAVSAATPASGASSRAPGHGRERDDVGQ
jgi:hypothetical protein